MGQLRTPVFYPEADGVVLAAVSVSSSQSATVYISKYDDKSYLSPGLLLFDPYLCAVSPIFSVTLICPIVNSAEHPPKACQNVVAA